MVRVNPNADLAVAEVPPTLEPANYEAISARMLTREVYSGGAIPRFGRQSFVDQIAHITSDGDPDYYLFTANSAIPIADAVRAFYDGMQRDCPPLAHININKRILEKRLGSRERLIDQEAERLRPFLEGAGRVSIVEQFVYTGNGLLAASRAARLAGAATCDNFDKSNWYVDADPRQIDLQNLTSTHRDFMRHIGAVAAERVQTGDYNQ